MMSTMKVIKPKPLERTLREVAIEIAELWPRVMEEGYLGLGGCIANRDWRAMREWRSSELDEQNATVVQSFLFNAGAWHGSDALRIKKELRGALAHFEQQTGEQWDEVAS